MIIRSVLVWSLLCLARLPASAQQATLLPSDEAAQHPDFFAVRARLLTALARHDTAAVLAVVAPEIHNTFGDDNGIEAFRRLWRLDSPDSPLWVNLAATLALGGTFESDSTFAAPYVFSQWPGEYDSFDYVAVIGSDVRVRAAPSLTAGVLGRWSFAVVKRALRPDPPLTAAQAEEWTPIELDGQVGYIASRYVRSPVGYRAVFTRRAGRWLMTSFIAGD